MRSAGPHECGGGGLRDHPVSLHGACRYRWRLRAWRTAGSGASLVVLAGTGAGVSLLRAGTGRHTVSQLAACWCRS